MIRNFFASRSLEGRPLLMRSKEALQLRRLCALEASQGGLRGAADPVEAIVKLGRASRADRGAFFSLFYGADPWAAPLNAEQVEHWPEAGAIIADRVAIIDVRGAIWDRGFTYGGEVIEHGYDTLARALLMAEEDDRVGGILLRVDSPGGMVEGSSALMEVVRALGKRQGAKPLHAHVQAQALSAAYWIACGADHIDVEPLGLVGSIGAVILHWDERGWLDQRGFKVTSITFGDKKMQGAPHEGLDDEALHDLRAQVREAGSRFVRDVAHFRGLEPDAVTAQQAGVFMAQTDEPDIHGDPLDARARGLIDGVAVEAEAFARIKDLSALRQPRTGGSPAAVTPAASAPAPSSTKETDMGKRRAMEEETLAMDELKDDIAAVMDNDDLSAEEKLQEIAAMTEGEEASAEGDDDGVSASEEETPISAEELQEQIAAVMDNDDLSAEEKLQEIAALNDSAETEAEGEDDKRQARGRRPSRAARGGRKRMATAQEILALPASRGRERLAAGLAGKHTLAEAKSLLSATPRNSPLANGVKDPKVSANGAGGGSSIKLSAAGQRLSAHIQAKHKKDRANA